MANLIVPWPQKREMAFRETSESTNSRVMWWSIGQTVLLIGSALWQIRHLKYFLPSFPRVPRVLLLNPSLCATAGTSSTRRKSSKHLRVCRGYFPSHVWRREIGGEYIKWRGSQLGFLAALTPFARQHVCSVVCESAVDLQTGGRPDCLDGDPEFLREEGDKVNFSCPFRKRSANRPRPPLSPEARGAILPTHAALRSCRRRTAGCPCRAPRPAP